MDEQWTDATRRLFATEADALAEAVRRHATAVRSLTGRGAEVPALFAANTELARAAKAFADAQFEFTGTVPSFTLPEEEDPEEEDPDGEPPPVARVRVLRRTDYDVTDVDAVIAAGRAAYRQVWPDDQEEDAVADVTGLSRALYQIEHAGGPAALDHAPGLVETSSSVVWNSTRRTTRVMISRRCRRRA